VRVEPHELRQRGARAQGGARLALASIFAQAAGEFYGLQIGRAAAAVDASGDGGHGALLKYVVST